MADNEDEALTSDAPTFKVKRSISEELRKQQEQQDAQGFFNFLPQFPRSFYLFNMFGKFSNIIPEETEDAVNQISTIPEKIHGDHAITEEVKKLGLTAELHPHEELTEFEPKWIKSEPKVKGHVRRHSGGIIRINETGDLKLQTRTSVDDNAAVEGQTHLHLDSEDKLDISHNDFSDLKCIPHKNATKSALMSAYSMGRRRGKLFRPYDEDEMNSLFELSSRPNTKRGELFRGSTEMRRSKSTSNLSQAQENTNIVSERDVSRTEIFKADADDSFDVQPDNYALRRTSSTGCLQRLQSAEGSDKLSSISQNAADHQKEKDKKTDVKEKKVTTNTLEHEGEHRLQKEPHQEKPVSKFGEKLNSLGKQTVQWATTSKVKQKKRENHMFSPTSF